MPNLSTQLQKCTDAYGYTVEGINTSAGHNFSWRIKSSGAHFTEICTVEPHFNTWWRHQMAIFSVLLALCEGNPPVAGGFPSQRPVTRSFGIFFSFAPEKTVEETIESTVIWDAIPLIMKPLQWEIIIIHYYYYYMILYMAWQGFEVDQIMNS